MRLPWKYIPCVLDMQCINLSARTVKFFGNGQHNMSDAFLATLGSRFFFHGSPGSLSILLYFSWLYIFAKLTGNYELFIYAVLRNMLS